MSHCPHRGHPAGIQEEASVVDSASGGTGGLDHRELFEANRAVMLLVDPESERIVDANPAAVSFYGDPEDVLKGKKMTDITTLPTGSTQERMKKSPKGRASIKAIRGQEDGIGWNACRWYCPRFQYYFNGHSGECVSHEGRDSDGIGRGRIPGPPGGICPKWGPS